MGLMLLRASAGGRFTGPLIAARCALGAGGVVTAAAKREGDRASPIGIWPLRRVLYRPDRAPPPETELPMLPLAPDDGWCDAPHDPAYNRPVKLPYPASAEALWREDHVYDLIVVIGHNDDPVVAGLGSAIFWHLARADWRPTEGCVAVDRETMLAALKAARPGDALEITG
jgi:L,D-peptidoglycan transpeptidase YkuD (ErfK/YbiS/YcfS/YnhG family)